MMKPKVYVETTIVSYLSALPNRDIVLAAHQQLTREWWARRDRTGLSSGGNAGADHLHARRTDGGMRMGRDPIVDEVRAIREAIAEGHGNDLKAIVAYFQRQDAASPVKGVSLPPKRLPDYERPRKAG